MNHLCTICIRKGSRGIKNKNILKINNIPLFVYTLKQALKSKLFKFIVVSTDSKKIALVAKRYGAYAPFLRPKLLSNDTSGKVKAIRHALKESEKHFKQKFDVVTDLDATSPLRSIKDLKLAYKKFVKEKASILLTACEAKKNPYFNVIEKKNKRFKVVKSIKNFLRRQDAPKVYEMNASIYIWKRENLLRSDNLFGRKTSVYLMPRSRSIDIDSALDLKLVKYLIKNKNGI